MKEADKAEVSFVQLITSDATRQQLAAMQKQRPDVRVLPQIMGQDRFFEWAHSVGVTTDDSLRSIAPPVPPIGLRRIVGAGLTEVNFLYTGLGDARALMGHFWRHAGARSPANILDFGCGCGRLLRFLSQLPDISAVGTDVNPDQVAWCRLALPDVTVKANGPLPPLDFEDASFDFIFSYSVFTHLSQKAMFAWLDELARVVKLGGIVLLTTHGEALIRLIVDKEPVRKSFQISKEQANDISSRFFEDGYVFVKLDEARLKGLKAGDDYGFSFMQEEYVRKYWPRDLFRIQEYIPANAGGRHDIGLQQDIVLMHRV